MKLNTLTAFLLMTLALSLNVMFFIQHTWQPKIAPMPITHTPSETKIDSRIVALQKFFARYKCPYSDEKIYLKTADTYGLDYRLLPAISVIESSCGRHYLHNNLFGWGSATGLRHFQSIAEGVDYVGSQLAQGGYYRGKTLEAKLKIYNSVNPNYTSIVKGLMTQISR